MRAHRLLFIALVCHGLLVQIAWASDAGHCADESSTCRKFVATTEPQHQPTPREMALRIVAICGSLRKSSVNAGLLRAAARITSTKYNEQAQMEILDIGRLPLFNKDIFEDGQPPKEVQEFREKLAAADCIVFANPEYNYSFTGVLKNAIDWASNPSNVIADKAAGIVGAGGGLGSARAQYHLRQVMVFLDVHVLNKPEVLVRAFADPKPFNDDGDLVSEAEVEKLDGFLAALIKWTARLKGQ